MVLRLIVQTERQTRVLLVVAPLRIALHVHSVDVRGLIVNHVRFVGILFQSLVQAA